MVGKMTEQVTKEQLGQYILRRGAQLNQPRPVPGHPKWAPWLQLFLMSSTVFMSWQYFSWHRRYRETESSLQAEIDSLEKELGVHN